MDNLEKTHIPVCPEGVCNCLYDPAYIAERNQTLYREIFGERTPDQVTEWLMDQLGETT